MKGIVESQDAELRLRVRPCEFQATLDGFASAVRKKDTIHAGYLRKLFSETALILVVDQVRHMKRFLDLLPQCLLYTRMVLTERIDADAGKKVKVPLIRLVDEVRAGAAIDENFITGV